MKKKVSNFKDELQNIKITLEKFDEDLKQKIAIDKAATKNKKIKSVPVEVNSHDTSSDSNNEKITDEDNMKNAFDRKFC